MKPDVYKVFEIGNGALYVMPKPSIDWLEDDVSYFHSIGIDSVLSLLEIRESYDLGLQKEGEILAKYGIEYLNFPIKDRGLPDKTRFCDLIKKTCSLVSGGDNLAVHCRAGIGRTGLVASCVLIEYGIEPQDAIDMVSAARGVSVPDTQEQYDFILDYRS